MVAVIATNDRWIPGAVARFSEGIDYGRGDTLHFVSAVETVSFVIDSKNLEKLTRVIPTKNILRVYHKLAEIIVSLSEETIFTPGIVATISGELARNGINIFEYLESIPHEIIIVNEKDALRSYQLLQKLASGSGK